MATVQDVVNQALRTLGVLAAGETPAYEDSADALVTLNNLIDQWAAERLAIYTVTRTTWAIVSGTSTYTVGSGGSVNIAWPVYVDRIGYQDTATDIEYPLGELTEDGYASLSDKTLTASVPTVYYYNPTYAAGLASVILWPTPTGTTLEGVIYCPTAVAEFAGLASTVSLPPGYRQFLVSNLALALSAEYGRNPHQALIKAAEESKATLKRMNFRMADLAVGFAPGMSDGWTIRTGP